MVPDDIDGLLEAGYRYAFALAHDASDAEDLLQDAVVSILAAGGAWERHYLFVTIRNRFIDRRRRNRKILFLALDTDDERHEVDLADQNWEAPDVFSADLLQEALGALRSVEREALFLSIVEGYTAEEIARMTGRSRGTILSILYRTKAKLRKLLEKRREVL